MSDITVVDKEELQGFRNYIYWFAAFLGASVASFVVGLSTDTAAAYIPAALYAAGLLGVWYLFKDDFSNIRQAIKDAEGGNQ